jgi:hypothetical protein
VEALQSYIGDSTFWVLLGIMLLLAVGAVVWLAGPASIREQKTR